MAIPLIGWWVGLAVFGVWVGLILGVWVGVLALGIWQALTG